MVKVIQGNHYLVDSYFFCFISIGPSIPEIHMVTLKIQKVHQIIIDVNALGCIVGPTSHSTHIPPIPEI